MPRSSTAPGAWSREQATFEDAPEGAELWLEPEDVVPFEKGAFIVQVQGDSMVPLIPNGGWCLFRPPRDGGRQGRVVLAGHSGIADPHTGGQYTVKVYHWEKAADPDQGFYHARIELRPKNPAYQPVVLEPREEGEMQIIAEFVRVLGT